MSDQALSFAGQKDVPAVVFQIRHNDVPQTDRVVNMPPDSITYDILIWTQAMKGYIHGMTPENRVASGVNLTSAKAGTPCRVVLSADPMVLPRLYLHEEEVPFVTCEPATVPFAPALIAQ